MCINAKATPINDTNYICHITAVELSYPIIYVESTSYHITRLVINSLRADTQTHTHTDVRMESILRNQVHAWFKN